MMEKSNGKYDRSYKIQDIHIFSCFSSVDTKNFRRILLLSGRNADVQAILCQSYTTAIIYVHCFGHKLNLLICDVSKTVSYLSECCFVVSKIDTYFH